MSRIDAKALAQVALPRALAQPLLYEIPEELRGVLRPGHRVRVPLRGKRAHGIVAGITDEASAPAGKPGMRLRSIEALDPEEVLLSPALLKLVTWVARYYAAPIGIAAETAVPRMVARPPRMRKRSAGAEGGAEDSGGKERAAQKLIELLGPVPSDTYVLDVGTGQGFLALRLAERGFRVLGIDSGCFDYSKDSIQKAREQARGQGGDVEFRQADIRRLDEPDESFDCIVSSQAVHCMEDQVECLKAVHRFLKPGGRLLCIDFLVGLQGFLQHGFHCFLALSREEWVELLVEHGFSDIRMYEMGDHLLIECTKS
jgi:ubiquinone/menaquinone biosynthesis C-methylase UbiE